MFRDVGHVHVPGKFRPEQVVFRHGRPEPDARAQEGLAAHHDPRHCERAAEKHLDPDSFVRDGILDLLFPGIVRPEHRIVTAAQVDLRVLSEECCLASETFRRTAVVGIHERNETPARCLQSPVAGIGGAVVRVVAHQDDPCVLRGITACDIVRGVRRGVVDNDQLEIPDGLSEDVADAFADESLCVVEWHDDAYEGGLLFHRCLLFG